jgi:predicted amidohydrolase YtcJ
VEEALEMHTSAAAKAAGLEGLVGSLTPGKNADLVLLSRDPLRCPPEALKDIRVRMTMIGGEVVWSAENG